MPNNTARPTRMSYHTPALQHTCSGARAAILCGWLRAHGGRSAEGSLWKEERQVRMSFTRRHQLPCFMPCLRRCAGLPGTATLPLTCNVRGRNEGEEMKEGEEKSERLRPQKRQPCTFFLFSVSISHTVSSPRPDTRSSARRRRAGNNDASWGEKRNRPREKRRSPAPTGPPPGPLPLSHHHQF